MILGVAAAVLLPVGAFASIAWPLTGLTLVLIACLRRKFAVIPLALIGGMLIGSWRGSVAHYSLQAWQPLFGKEIIVKGTISEDVDKGKRGETIVRLNDLTYRGQSSPGTVWLSAAPDLPLKRSDRITVRGKLSPGFGSFVGAIYRADIQKLERPVPGDVALQVRDWFAGAVRQVIPEPQASLGIGYLVGQRRALPPELDQALRIAGLTHVVVASGYNLTILVRLARRLFARISKYMAAFASGGMVVAFIAITGMSPSMARAGLVAGLSLLAWYYGRKFHPLVLLPLAAAITVLINPTFVWGDLGWQLSFAAFAGVMILAPLGQAYFFGTKKPGTVRQILGETIAAGICTLPILVAAFGQFSLVSVVANLLVLPLVPLAMLLTFIAGIAAVTIPAFAGIISLPATWLLTYMTSVAEFLSSQPWAMQEVTASWWLTGGLYAVIVSLCIYFAKRTGYSLRNANIIE